MALPKYIYWDTQHLAGYLKETNGIIVDLVPISNGVKQKWSTLFFNKLIETKQIQKITQIEYQLKLKRLEQAAQILGEYGAKKQFKREQINE